MGIPRVWLWGRGGMSTSWWARAPGIAEDVSLAAPIQDKKDAPLHSLCLPVTDSGAYMRQPTCAGLRVGAGS